jgi:hypothetical protein
MDKKEKAADTRLRKVRGISLEEYNELEKNNNHCCWICGRKVNEDKRLAVDHDHRFDKYKYIAEKTGSGKWTCRAVSKYTIIGPNQIVWIGNEYNSSKEAKDALRKVIKRRSIRGLLCFRCNRGLAYWRDNISNMANAIKYLQSYEDLLMGGKYVID